MANNGKLLWIKSKNDPRWWEKDDAAEEGRLPRYVHTMPSKAKKEQFAVGAVIGSSPLADALLSPTGKVVASGLVVTKGPALARALVKGIKAATGARMAVGAGIWEGATVGGLGVGAFLAAAGLGSYFGTRYILDHFPTKSRRLLAASQAYRQSRLDLARELGRELLPAELKALSDHYKAVTADINSYPI